jgi:hypothetical protein
MALCGAVSRLSARKDTTRGNADPLKAAERSADLARGNRRSFQCFDSEAALIDYVAATPGAIGYVSKEADREKVKALAIK